MLESSNHRTRGHWALFLLVIAVASGLALLLMVEMRFWMPTSWRSIFFWAWVVAATALLFRLVHSSLDHRMDPPFTVQKILRVRWPQEQPALQNQLVSLLELCNGDASPAPQPLVDHAVQSLDAEVSKLPLLEKVKLASTHRLEPIYSDPAWADRHAGSRSSAGIPGRFRPPVLSRYNL